MVPLAIYLLTFIIAFDSPRWYSPFYYIIALTAALGAGCVALHEGADMEILRQVAVYSVLLNGGPGGGNARFVDLFTLSMLLLLIGLLAPALSVVAVPSGTFAASSGISARLISPFASPKISTKWPLPREAGATRATTVNVNALPAARAV